jgi:alkanesulfonate monooxygenase SsuD/methylene tetrahydromethanopterin reductase-like flavin-dependent oxidoreductase (luciferase family)
MTAHSWVKRETSGPRSGVLLTGARGRTTDGAFLMYDQPVNRIVDTARVAEDLGFDAVFVGDHPTILPDPFVCLSSLAISTVRLRLGTLVVVPSFRHPTMLARLASDVDHLSAGRLILGLGVGQVEADFNALGLPVPTMADRRRLLSETIELLDGIWSQERYSYSGRYVVATAVRGIPSPIQSPRPPIIIAGVWS